MAQMKTDERLTIDLDANGKPQKLYFTTNNKERKLYSWWRSPDGYNKSNLITDSPAYIIIFLKANNGLTARFRFRITHSADVLRLERLNNKRQVIDTAREFRYPQLLTYETKENNDALYKPNVQMRGRPNKVQLSNGVIANIPFANIPKIRTPENDSYRVRAEITYLDENKKLLFSWIRGRWTDTKFLSELEHGKTHEIESIVFPNDGSIRWLEVLIKRPEDEFCYGFNNTSTRESPKSWLYPDFKITKKRFFIQVELIGNFVNDNIWMFEVETKGKGDTFRIWREGEKWQPETSSQATKKPRQKRQKKKPSPNRTSTKP